MEIHNKVRLRPCRWKWHISQPNVEWDCGVFHLFFPWEGIVGAVLENGNGEVIVVHDIATSLALQFTDNLAGEIFDLETRSRSENG